MEAPVGPGPLPRKNLGAPLVGYLSMLLVAIVDVHGLVIFLIQST